MKKKRLLLAGLSYAKDVTEQGIKVLKECYMFCFSCASTLALRDVTLRLGAWPGRFRFDLDKIQSSLAGLGFLPSLRSKLPYAPTLALRKREPGQRLPRFKRMEDRMKKKGYLLQVL